MTDELTKAQDLLKRLTMSWGCNCAAWSANECSCADANWPEHSITEAVAYIKELQAALTKAAADAHAMAIEQAARVAESYEPRCDVCPSGAVTAIRALSPSPDMVLVPRDCRRWKYHVVPMPVNSKGHGPATVGKDAVRIEYEVWKADDTYQAGASFDNLPEAINRAMVCATTGGKW